MSNRSEDFFKRLGNLLKERNNPTDLKASIIGKVVQLEPIIDQIEDGLPLLEEDEELEISEWFRFRCNIDKNSELSGTVPNLLQSAKQIQEVHSNGGAACNMSTAVQYLANAIETVSSCLLNLKCDLKQGDFVIVSSLEETNKYILIDKV